MNNTMNEINLPPADQLADITVRRLFQFRQRRLMLASVRGLSIAAALFVLTLLVALALDASVEDSLARWSASLLVYAIAFASLYYFCWRPWFSRLDLSAEAKRIEASDPSVKDHLLSAVELSQRDNVEVSDSTAFRRELQRQVAQALAPVDIRRLQPWSEIARLLTIALAVVLGFGVLCLIPTLRFPHRIARVLLPAADLGRVSSVAIQIERPLPHSKTLPRGDVAAITARIDGPRPDHVSLQTRTSKGQQTASMAELISPSSLDSRVGSDASRFESTLATDHDWIEYRVCAAGASTPWYRITTQPRPTVIDFEKTWNSPEYSDEPSKTWVETHGDIRALIGSRIDLALNVDQAVNLAEIRWSLLDEQGQSRVTELHWDATRQRLLGSFTVHESGSYRVFLQSGETGFTNAFSPSYQVVAEEDKAPVVQWVEPSNPSITAAATELLALAIRVADDLPVRHMRQWARTNSSEWQELPATAYESKEQHDTPYSPILSWKFDLLPYAVQSGDMLETKVVARDQHGSVGESPVLLVMITSMSIDFAATEAEVGRRRIAEQLRTLADDISSHVSALSNPEATLGDAANELAESIRAQTSPILAEVKRISSLNHNSVSGMELRTVGEVLLRMQSVEARQLATLAMNSEDEQTQAKISKLAKNVDALAKDLAGHMQTLASHDSFSRHAEQLARLASAQAALAQDKDGSAAQHLRRQSILTRQTKDVQQSVLESLDHVRKESRDRLKQVADQLGNFIAQAEQQTDTTDPQAVQKLASTLASSFSGAKLMARMDGGLPEAIKRSQRWLGEQREDPSSSLRELATSLERSPLQDSQSADVVQQLGQHREIVRNGAAANLDYAADLGNAGRAVKAIMESSNATDPSQAQSIDKVGQALRTLAVAAQVAETSAQMDELLKGERWNLNSNSAIMEHPRLWDALTVRLELAAKNLRAAKMPNELANQLDRLRGDSSAQQINQRMGARRWQLESPISAADDLEKQVVQLQSVQLQLAPLVKAARQQLGSLAPNISELAKKAASETERLSQQTKSLSNAIRRDEVPSTETRLAQLEHHLQQLDDPMSNLRDALVDQADAQNLLDTHSLQTVRTADAAIDIVDRAEEQTQRSLDDIELTQNQSSQASALNRAASKQQDAAAALDQLASLFGESPDQQATDPTQADPLASLNSLAEQLEPGGQISDTSTDYDRAQRLAKLAETSPEAMLRQLEEQLSTNKPMQEEMSDIARAAASQALDGLEQAAKQQMAIVPDLEASDPYLRTQKQLLVHDLQATRDTASQMLGLLLSEAKGTAGAAKATDEETKLMETEAFLRKELEPNSAVALDMPFFQLQSKAQQWQNALKQIHDRLSASSEQLNEASINPIHNNGADLNNRRREMKDRQRRIAQQDSRNAQQAERNQQQKSNQATKEWEQAVQRVANDEKKLGDLQKRAAGKSKDQNVLKQMADAERQLRLLKVAASVAELARDQFQQRAERAKESLQEINQLQTSELASVNPAAELAAQLTEQAAQRSHQLAEMLSAWGDSQPFEARPTSQQLQKNLGRQDSIRDEIDRAEQHLERAARHEMRLENPRTSQQLDALAAGVQQVGQGEVQTAKERLSEANSTADPIRSPTGQASPESTAAATLAISQAERAIRSSADSLRNLLTRSQSDSQAKSNQPSDAAAPAESDSELLDGQQMAQLLDELDRQLHQDLNLGAKEDDAQASQKAASQPAAPSTLAAAAQQLASQLSRSRQPPPTPANSDLGMATESQMANVSPQAPVGVQVVDVARVDGEWGELRSRDAQDSVETRRESISPRYRQQVEAYFRSLSIQARQREGTKP